MTAAGGRGALTLTIFVDAVANGPIALEDVLLRALFREVAAEPVTVDGDEGWHHRSANGRHHLVVNHSRHMRAHVAHKHVGSGEQFECRGEREGHIISQVLAELHPSTLFELRARVGEKGPVEVLLHGQAACDQAIGVICRKQHRAQAVHPPQLAQLIEVDLPRIAISEPHALEPPLALVPRKHAVEWALLVALAVARVTAAHMHGGHGRAQLIGRAAAMRAGHMAQHRQVSAQILAGSGSELREDLRDATDHEVLQHRVRVGAGHGRIVQRLRRLAKRRLRTRRCAHALLMWKPLPYAVPGRARAVAAMPRREWVGEDIAHSVVEHVPAEAWLRRAQVSRARQRRAPQRRPLVRWQCQMEVVCGHELVDHLADGARRHCGDAKWLSIPLDFPVGTRKPVGERVKEATLAVDDGAHGCVPLLEPLAGLWQEAIVQTPLLFATVPVQAIAARPPKE